MVGKTFNTLADNEVRWTPWLGSAWFVPGRESAAQAYTLEHKQKIISSLAGYALQKVTSEVVTYVNIKNKTIRILANTYEQKQLFQMRRQSIKQQTLFDF